MLRLLMSGEGRAALFRETLRSGTVAGLAMMPFAAVFRMFDLRINEYGRKTLELIVGVVSPQLHNVLNFAQHMIISWIAAVPLLMLLANITGRRARILAGVVYGGVFYVALNSLALPLAFGDPTPWTLGFSTVLPSLVVHVVYGAVVAWMARPILGAQSRAMR
jgi:uncharacterized membrane protein YagU involved in acid resistance